MARVTHHEVLNHVLNGRHEQLLNKPPISSIRRDIVDDLRQRLQQAGDEFQGACDFDRTKDLSQDGERRQLRTGGGRGGPVRKQ